MTEPISVNHTYCGQQPMYDSRFASIEHQVIDKNVTDSSKDVVRAITASDHSMSHDICNVNENVLTSSASIRDANSANTLGLRDAIASNTIGLRDSIASSTLGIRDSVERHGAANMSATTTSGYESRLAIANTNATILNAICVSTDKLSSQSAAQNAIMLLEQQKVKECFSLQLADAKYEGLKNKETLSAQIAAAACENKYEALKNTQMLASQLAECCCEMKTGMKDVAVKMDDTLRMIDTNRIRDALNTANNEINLLKLSAYTCRGRSRSPSRT